MFCEERIEEWITASRKRAVNEVRSVSVFPACRVRTWSRIVMSSDAINNTQRTVPRPASAARYL